MVDSESTALPLGYIPIWLALIFYAFPSKSQPEISNFLVSPPPDGFAPLTPQACTPRMQDILICSVSDRIKVQSRVFLPFNLCVYSLPLNRFISQFSKMKTKKDWLSVSVTPFFQASNTFVRLVTGAVFHFLSSQILIPAGIVEF